jgi:hypothetical protein
LLVCRAIPKLRFAVRLTKQKLGQAVPDNLTEDAEHLYRERFLREKHDLETVDVVVTTKDAELDPGDDTVHIAEIVEEATADEQETDGPTDG